MTISDTIERGLKRGKVDEQIAAANLVGVFCAQIGSSDDGDFIADVGHPMARSKR